MSALPNRLRSARESAGLSIQQLSHTTKINIPFLKAMERGEFEQLPGEFFTRNFLRMYAREVGLSQDDVVAEYDVAYGVVEPEPVAADAEPALADHGKHVEPVELDRAPARATRKLTLPTLPDLRLQSRPTLTPIVAGALMVLLIVSVMRNRPDAQGSTPPTAVGTSGVAEASQPASPPTAPDVTPDTLTLDVRPVGEGTWLTATADGERLFSRLVKGGEHVAVEWRSDLVLRVGNAGGFEYSINGVPGKSLGGAGEVRDVQITRDNFRTFRR